MVILKVPINRWNNYSNHDTVIINDVDRSNAAKLAYYLKNSGVDPYPLLVEIKGSMLYIDPSYIFVTSNYRISDLYDDQQLRIALHERFYEIVVYDWRETPEGMIEIQILDDTVEGNMVGTRWINQHTILDL